MFASRCLALPLSPAEGHSGRLLSPKSARMDYMVRALFPTLPGVKEEQIRPSSSAYSRKPA